MSRKPPKPKTWNSPRGWCRSCGEIIMKGDKQNLRRNWHPECYEIYLITTDPTAARRYIWGRENGVCQSCGFNLANNTIEILYQLGTILWRYNHEWQVDHHNPLFEADNNLSYWLPENLRLLCSKCHKTKCKEEAKRRACFRKNKI